MENQCSRAGESSFPFLSTLVFSFLQQGCMTAINSETKWKNKKPSLCDPKVVYLLFLLNPTENMYILNVALIQRAGSWVMPLVPIHKEIS